MTKVKFCLKFHSTFLVLNEQITIFVFRETRTKKYKNKFNMKFIANIFNSQTILNYILL